MLARKVVTRRGRRFRGYFPSQKLGRMVAWESLLERDAILLLECSSGVVSYREQPTLIEYFDGQQIRGYYPDFEVVLMDGGLLHVEVKASFELAKPTTADKFRAVAKHYQSLCQHFRILTELEIRREPLFSNLKKLHLHRRYRGELAPALAQASRLLRTNPVALGALGLDTATVWCLLANGHLLCDLAAPITVSTLISLSGGRDDLLLF